VTIEETEKKSADELKKNPLTTDGTDNTDGKPDDEQP
jgi:hypothetical protein